MPGRVFQRGDIYWIAFYSTGKEYPHKREDQEEA